MEAHSDGPGKGSEFVIRLPRGRPPIEKPSPPPTQVSGKERPRSILLVDDNAEAADTLACLLRARRYEVVTAFSGPTALKIADDLHPEVVILDLGMPGIDGCEVAETLRAREGGESLTLVALTGWGGAEDRQRTAAAGFDYHFVKPARVEELESAMTSGRRNQPAEASI